MNQDTSCLLYTSSIGLLTEYDALAGIGHACGHHLQGPCILAAANAVLRAGIEKPFKLVVYGTPAEETLGGKINMVQEGYFRDIDVALMMHGSPTTDVYKRQMGSLVINVTEADKERVTAWLTDRGILWEVLENV